MLGGFIATYFIMETKGYFLQVEYFRPVIATVATLNFSGIVCAVLGVYKERRMLLQMHVTMLRSLMVFADMIALSVIVIMAIGNRWKTSERLPKYLVNEKLFYNFLGPFWMYLGAISLHITVAGNMCGLQVMNNCLRYFEEKERALQTTR